MKLTLLMLLHQFRLAGHELLSDFVDNTAHMDLTRWLHLDFIVIDRVRQFLKLCNADDRVGVILFITLKSQLSSGNFKFLNLLLFIISLISEENSPF